MKVKVLLLLFCLTGLAGSAQLRLPQFFSDHMVLQQNSTTKIWGWAKAGSQVAVKAGWLADTLKATTTGDAAWTIDLPTTKAGKEQEIVILSGSEKIVLKDVAMGEVWLCSGQSNMQWNSGNKLPEMLERLPTIANKQIRFLQVPNIATKTEQADITTSWELCDSASAAPFSAIGYFFAEKLNKDLDVPIGIINASWGGTCAEVWTPEQAVTADAELQKAALLQTVAPRKPNLPGRAWNSMIAPLVGYNIAGALWYQGENNVVSWNSYEKLFTKMIREWRQHWNKDFPFYFAQIAPYTYKNKNLPKAAFLREAQTNTMIHNHKNKIAMVVTSDLVPDVANIHPTRKREVAERFANLALVNEYKKSEKNPYPALYKSMTKSGNKLILDFYFMENEKLKLKGKKLDGIYIAGADKVFYPAVASVDKNKLVVSSTRVKDPVAVRYAFTETALTEQLYSSNNLPVPLFRTDSWNDTDVQVMEK